jgi:hypothetical protein
LSEIREKKEEDWDPSGLQNLRKLLTHNATSLEEARHYSISSSI